MKKTRQMGAGLQEWNLRRELASAGVDTELGDLKSDIDRTLSFQENKSMIMKARGVSPKKATDYHSQHERAHIHAHGGKVTGYHQARITRSEQEGEYYQIGTSHREIDRLVDAKWPGKRKSATGHYYVERRKNWSDYPGSRT